MWIDSKGNYRHRGYFHMCSFYSNCILKWQLKKSGTPTVATRNQHVP
jgi:hypothetical protein